MNEGRNLRQRAFYYTHVTADPKDKDTVYVLNVGTFKSTDGGKTMVNFAGGDSHDLWIDPDDTQHILHASDSGGAVTYNAASPQRTWSARDYPTGAVLSRGHDHARAVSRLRRAAGQQHDLRAERHEPRVRPGRGGGERWRRRTRRRDSGDV